MIKKLIDKARAFYKANTWLDSEGGKVLSGIGLEKVPLELQGKIPVWYLEILKTIPLIGATVGIPNNHGLPELQDKPLLKCPSMWVKFLSLSEILEAVTENYLDEFLFKYEYLPIMHYDNVGTNICIKINRDNPALVLFYPGWFEKLSDLESEAEVILPKFSDLFQVARNTSFLPGDEVEME